MLVWRTQCIAKIRIARSLSKRSHKHSQFWPRPLLHSGQPLACCPTKCVQGPTGGNLQTICTSTRARGTQRLVAALIKLTHQVFAKQLCSAARCKTAKLSVLFLHDPMIFFFHSSSWTPESLNSKNRLSKRWVVVQWEESVSLWIWELHSFRGSCGFLFIISFCRRTDEAFDLFPASWWCSGRVNKVQRTKCQRLSRSWSLFLASCFAFWVDLPPQLLFLWSTVCGNSQLFSRLPAGTLVVAQTKTIKNLEVDEGCAHCWLPLVQPGCSQTAFNLFTPSAKISPSRLKPVGFFVVWSSNRIWTDSSQYEQLQTHS